MRGTIAIVSVASALACGGQNAGPERRNVETTSGQWTHVGLDGEWVTALASTPVGLFAGTHANGVFRLDPARARWVSSGLDHAVVSTIAYQADQPARVLVGLYAFEQEQTGAAVYASANQGASWTAWDGGLASQRNGRGSAFGLAVDPQNPKRVLISFFDQMARSVDGGQSWQITYGAERSPGGGAWRAIVFAPSGGGVVWAAGENSLFQGRMVVTRDGGGTWENVSVDPGAGVLSLAAHPSITDRLLAGMRAGGILRSDDGGASWRTAYSANDPTGLVNAALFVGDTLYMAAAVNFRADQDRPDQPNSDLAMYRSVDGGETWQTLDVPPDIRGGGYALAPGNAGSLIIGTRHDGVWQFQPR